MTQRTIQGRIKELRKNRNLSQKRAALIFHVDTSQWSRFESGYRAIPLQLVEEICQVWHVSADYLLFGERDTENQIDLSGLSLSQIHAVKVIVDGLRHS